MDYRICLPFAALCLTGCVIPQIAQNPISQPDPAVAEAVEGVWEIKQTHEEFGIQRWSQLTFKTLPNGMSLCGYRAEGDDAYQTGVVTWAKHNHKYIGFFETFLQSATVPNPSSGLPLGFVFNTIVVATPTRQGTLQIELPMWSHEYSREEFAKELRDYDIQFEQPGDYDILIDDQPQKVFNWLCDFTDRIPNSSDPGRMMTFRQVGELPQPFTLFQNEASQSFPRWPKRNTPVEAPQPSGI